MGLRLPALIVLLALAGCDRAADTIADATQEAANGIEDPIEDTQVAVAEAVNPVIIAMQGAAEVVSQALPEPGASPLVDPAAVALIVRWEVTSEAVYTRKYQGVICPGGASGPTIGIGYDLGHQSSATIAREWAHRPDVARLQEGAGVIGPADCAAYRNSHRDIRVSFDEASRVFGRSTLPTYQRAAGRALRDGWDSLPLKPQGANVSLGYNRGWSMAGDRNREKRVIRDTCVPNTDTGCIATQLRAMCRIWRGTNLEVGLCARRNDEARLAES